MHVDLYCLVSVCNGFCRCFLELRASGLFGAFEEDFFGRFADSPGFDGRAEFRFVLSVLFERCAFHVASTACLNAFAPAVAAIGEPRDCSAASYYDVSTELCDGYGYKTRVYSSAWEHPSLLEVEHALSRSRLRWLRKAFSET